MFGAWGNTDHDDCVRIIRRALDAGVNFVDTADVYGAGRSERLVARLRRERRGERIFVATKAGRRLPQQTPEGYSRPNLSAWVDRSLKNLELDAVDLLQLHCPHPKVYDRPEVFGALEELVKEGKIRYYGISVETVDEALRGIRHAGVRTVQIIFNMLRLKPAEELFAQAWNRRVGILARVPLASGLLTGKLTKASSFASDDHRSFNRNGEAFDKGETFSGVPYNLGLEVVDRLRPLVPPGATMSQLALRWTLMFEAVSCAIPGARTPQQARDNASAALLPPLSPATMAAVKAAYDEKLRPLVHASW